MVIMMKLLIILIFILLILILLPIQLLQHKYRVRPARVSREARGRSGGRAHPRDRMSAWLGIAADASTPSVHRRAVTELQPASPSRPYHQRSQHCSHEPSLKDEPTKQQEMNRQNSKMPLEERAGDCQLR